MKNGIRRKEIDVIEHEIQSADLEQEQRQAVEEELEANRERQLDLRKQIDHLRDMLANSQKAIGLSEDHFRAAISSALEILSAPALKDSGNGGGAGPIRYVFPPV